MARGTLNKILLLMMVISQGLYIGNLNGLFRCTYYRKLIPLSLCILCTLMPQMIPLLTLTLVRMWYEESTPGGNIFRRKSSIFKFTLV